MLPTFAMDRRTIDQDGRMHVPGCRISKANVCGYRGREIPDWQTLGLVADAVYQMYRDPQALAEAAKTFENVPLTVDHVPVSADVFPAAHIGGTVSNARFEDPYLVADVTVWTADAIGGIESGEQKELSCAYRYVASMIPGTSPDGVRYDGRMIGPIKANHVALVEKGRAGPDVVVADGAPRMSTAKSRYPKFLTALVAALATVAKPEQMAAMDAAITEELAAAEDGFPDLNAEDMKAACDAAMKALGKDSLTDEEKRSAYQRAAKDKSMPKGPEGGAPNPNPAANDAAIKLAVDAALKDTVPKADADKMASDAATAASTAVHALYAARDAVADRVGLVTMDSAEAVYRFALDKLAVPHKDVPADALAALYAGVQKLPLAQDSLPTPVAPVRVADLFSTGHIRR